MKKVLLILAAGLGTRYGGIKQLDKVGLSDARIIEYSIFDAIKAGFNKVVFVIRESIFEDFKNLIGDKVKERIDIHYVFQEIDSLPEGITYSPKRKKPWGTAHAVLQAKHVINEPFTIINADDFYGFDSFRISSAFIDTLINETTHLLVGYKLGNTLSDYGAVARGICKVDPQNNLISIEEHTQIRKENNGIFSLLSDGSKVELNRDDIASMNMFTFHPNIFHLFQERFDEFIKNNSMSETAECYVPTVVQQIIESKKSNFKVILTNEKWFGLTYKADKENVVQQINELIDKGYYPKSLWN